MSTEYEQPPLARRDFREETWVRVGHTVRTLRVQPETGLRFDKSAKIASCDGAVDEDGDVIRGTHLVELADLLAAAPEMLRALKSIIDYSTPIPDVASDYVVRSAIQQAGDAIAKAVVEEG